MPSENYILGIFFTASPNDPSIPHAFVKLIHNDPRGDYVYDSVAYAGGLQVFSATERAKYGVLLPVDKSQAEAIRDYLDTLRMEAGEYVGNESPPISAVNAGRYRVQGSGNYGTLLPGPFYYSTQGVIPAQERQGHAPVAISGKVLERPADEIAGYGGETDELPRAAANCAIFLFSAIAEAGIPLETLHPPFQDRIDGVYPVPSTRDIFHSLVNDPRNIPQFQESSLICSRRDANGMPLILFQAENADTGGYFDIAEALAHASRQPDGQLGKIMTELRTAALMESPRNV